MITNLKTPTKSTRQKRHYARKRKILKQLVRDFDSYVERIENSNDPKIKRIVELGKQHKPMQDIYKIIEQEFPEE